MYNFSEEAIISTRASVLVYDKPNTKWVSAGTDAQLTLSKVQIFKQTENNRFRVVGRKMANHEVSYFS